MSQILLDSIAPRRSAEVRQADCESMSEPDPNAMVASSSRLMRERRKELKAAVIRGDLDSIRGSFASDIGSPTEVLCDAARLGRYQVVAEMIKLGADIGTRDHLPLLHAAVGGFAEIVNLLLAAGANPDSRGGGALLQTLEATYWPGAAAKIDERARISLRLVALTPILRSGPELVLRWAVANQHISTVRQILLEYPQARDCAGDCLVSAASKNAFAAMNELLGGGFVPESFLGRALSAAVGANCHDSVAFL